MWSVMYVCVCVCVCVPICAYVYVCVCVNVWSMLHVFCCGRKPEYPEETHASTGRTCKLHTERTSWPGFDPRTFVLCGDSANHWATVLPKVCMMVRAWWRDIIQNCPSRNVMPRSPLHTCSLLLTCSVDYPLTCLLIDYPLTTGHLQK